MDGVSLGYNAFYRATNYDKLNYDVSSYSVDSAGAGVTLGYPISEESRLTFGLSAQSDKIKLLGSYPAVEIQKFIAQEGRSLPTSRPPPAGASLPEPWPAADCRCLASLFLEATAPAVT